MAGILIIVALVVVNYSPFGKLSPQIAGERTINFVNQHIEEGMTASLVSVSDEGVVYRIHLKIQGGETAGEYDSYMTKNGKFLFPSGYNLEEQTEETPIETETPVYTNLDSFAQCLTDKGMKFYGSEYCGWCTKQKEVFSDAFSRVVYIECIDPETDQWLEECQTAGIESTPTWILPDGQKSPGYKTLEQLSELSQCSLQ